MVLTRAVLLLLVVFAAACDQSLFDAHVDEVDAGGADAGGPLCPGTCVGDAFADYGSAQGGANGRWHYLADRRATNGVDRADLTPGTPLAGASGWVSDGTPAAGVLACTGAVADLPVCAGLDRYLVLVPSQVGAGRRDPVLAFTVPTTGRFHVTGQVRLPDSGATGVMQDFTLSRNGRLDYVYLDTFSPSLTPRSFDLDVFAVAGDVLLLSTVPHGPGVASPVGVRFFVSEGEAGAGTCAYTARLDETDFGAGAADPCAGAPWTALGIDAVEPVAPSYGHAAGMAIGDYLQGKAGPIDRSGDFTLQFWFKDAPDTSGGNPIFEVVYGDIQCQAQGGLWVNVRDEGEEIGSADWDLSWAYHDEEYNWCVAAFERLTWTAQVDYDVWHFLRIVRSTAEERLRVCVDGAEVASSPVGGELDLTGVDPPYLGKDGNFEPEDGGNTTGAYDDFRAFSVALPCGPGPG
jgi:hypothetical protein